MGDKTPPKKTRRGTAPKRGAVPKPPDDGRDSSLAGHPLLCLRHCQPGWGVEELTPDQCRDFLVKWEKRSKLTWEELVQHPKHGLGSELLHKSMFKPSVPEHLDRDRYLVFRHEGNLPFAGFRAGDTFHVLWIEQKYNDLYNH